MAAGGAEAFIIIMGTMLSSREPMTGRQKNRQQHHLQEQV